MPYVINMPLHICGARGAGLAQEELAEVFHLFHDPPVSSATWLENPMGKWRFSVREIIYDWKFLVDSAIEHIWTYLNMVELSVIMIVKFTRGYLTWQGVDIDSLRFEIIILWWVQAIQTHASFEIIIPNCRSNWHNEWKKTPTCNLHPRLGWLHLQWLSDWWTITSMTLVSKKISLPTVSLLRVIELTFHENLEHLSCDKKHKSQYHPYIHPIRNCVAIRQQPNISNSSSWILPFCKQTSYMWKPRIFNFTSFSEEVPHGMSTSM